jgi:NAD(P)-dependent dehydrogenase (short-subunit alcohol dehydrogenase family)
MASQSTQRLGGKIALVLGGNGDIGGAIAKGLCEAGARVVATGRNKARIKKINTELKKLGNDWDSVIPVDITSRIQIKKITAAIKKKYHAIDILVCASGAYLNKSAEKVTDREWQHIMRTNLDGTFMAAQVVGREMLAAGSGSIITIGSLGSFVALSNTVAYSVSKAGVVALTRSLACEWAERGVRVNAIIPGVFPTRLNEKALAMPGRVENILKGIPSRKLGSLDQLIGAAVYLASNESHYVTGTSLSVDGGFLAFSGY